MPVGYHGDPSDLHLGATVQRSVHVDAVFVPHTLGMLCLIGSSGCCVTTKMLKEPPRLLLCGLRAPGADLFAWDNFSSAAVKILDLGIEACSACGTL